LLVDFSAEDIFKPTIEIKILNEISNNNGVRVVNFATSKNLTVKSTMFAISTNIIETSRWENPQLDSPDSERNAKTFYCT
jgi:hypothetical protein